MAFYQLVKRLTIDIFLLLALLVSCLFLYSQMIPFYTSAKALNLINSQSISYIVFSVLSLLLPIFLLRNMRRFNKRKVLRALFYTFSIVILVGTISDLVLYKCFIGYTYSEGDMVFVNILWNIPSMGGVALSLFVALLYFLIGKKITRRRRLPFTLYLIIFILFATIPFIYTYMTTGMLPRETYLQKALLLNFEQLLILVSLSICASSRILWYDHVWN